MASYYVWSGATGAGTGANWANAYTSLITANSGKVAGDVFFLAHDHAETAASSASIVFLGTADNLTKVICVDRAGSVPPVSADRRATAQYSATGSFTMIFLGSVHFDGLILNGGTGVNATIGFGGGAGDTFRLDNCAINLRGNGAGVANLNFGTTANGYLVELNNTTISYAMAANYTYVYGHLRWNNTPNAISGVVPNRLFMQPASRGSHVEVNGVDLSFIDTTIVEDVAGAQAGTYKFNDCKLHGSVLRSPASLSSSSVELLYTRCSSGVGNSNLYKANRFGTLDIETTVIRTGGASDNTTPVAWKVVSSAVNNYSLPFTCPPISIWNDTVGSAVTATIECTGSSPTATDAQVWLELEYLGDSASMRGFFVNDGATDLLATPVTQTVSGAAWGGGTNPFKLAVTFTPQQRGWIYARVKVGKPSSTVYIDPMVTLS
jgi:hypothetical protein